MESLIMLVIGMATIVAVTTIITKGFLKAQKEGNEEYQRAFDREVERAELKRSGR